MSLEAYLVVGFSAGVTNCDERIKSLKSKKNSWELYNIVLKIVNLEKYQDKINCYENNIKLVQVEKLIYNALLKNTSKLVFPLLLAKYDDLMTLSYDISGNLVSAGINLEGEHLEYCQQSLSQREFIKSICVFGESR